MYLRCVKCSTGVPGLWTAVVSRSCVLYYICKDGACSSMLSAPEFHWTAEAKYSARSSLICHFLPPANFSDWKYLIWWIFYSRWPLLQFIFLSLFLRILHRLLKLYRIGGMHLQQQAYFYVFLPIWYTFLWSSYYIHLSAFPIYAMIFLWNRPREVRTKRFSRFLVNETSPCS